jgi:Tfp pilus assembly protein PilF
MKYDIITIAFLTLIAVQINGQSRLSTPMEIMSFMEASPTQYKIDQLLGEAPKRSREVLANGTFIQIHKGREFSIAYEAAESCEEAEWRKEALALLNRERPKFKKARKLYQKILKLTPDNAQIMTYMGESYLLEHKLETAKEWFQLALSYNPIDYSAYRNLAEIFLKEEKIDSAVQAITTAHIFNRNNTLVLLRLQEIYAAAGKKYYSDWAFEPKYYLEDDADTVTITADGIWLTYAMYKAVWSYEADYHYIKSSQEVSDFLFHAEMEAALGTYLTYSAMRSEDQRNYPSMRAIEMALDNELLEAFVMYEILLVDHPTLAAHLTEDFMQKVEAYIRLSRLKDLR